MRTFVGFNSLKIDFQLKNNQTNEKNYIDNSNFSEPLLFKNFNFFSKQNRKNTTKILLEKLKFKGIKEVHSS